MPKVYSYIRFSTPGQRQGDSLHRQIRKAKSWAEERGYGFDENLSYRDLGVSGYDRSNLERGALGLFLQAVRDGRVERGDILVIEALDRLTRIGPLDAVGLLSELVKAGVTIVTAADGQEYTEQRLNTDLSCLMVASVILSRGHEESRQKSRRLKDHFDARRANGAGVISHVAPHWLRAEEGKWVAIPEYAATVRRVFELSASGVGVTKIARMFNAESVPIPRTTARPRGDGWHPATLAALLKNRAVIGHYQPCSLQLDGTYQPVGDVIQDHYPEIVPTQIFWKVQEGLASRRTAHDGYRRDSTYHNILAGMLHCGYCGNRMHLLRKGTASEGNRFYFVCPSAERGRTTCSNRINYRTLFLGDEPRTKGKHQRGRRYGFLERLLWALASHRRDITAGADKLVAALEARAIEITALLKEVKKRQDRLLEAVELGSLLLSEVTNRMAKLRNEAEELNQAMVGVEQDRAAMDPGQNSIWKEGRTAQWLKEIEPLLEPNNPDHVERAALRTRLGAVLEVVLLYRSEARIRVKGYDEWICFALSDEDLLPYWDFPPPFNSSDMVEEVVAP